MKILCLHYFRYPNLNNYYDSFCVFIGKYNREPLIIGITKIKRKKKKIISQKGGNSAK